MHPQPTVLFLIFVVVITISVVRSYRKLRLLPNEPRIAPGWMPFLGHTYGYGRDVYTFIARARSLLPQFDPFTCMVFGKRFYIVLHPSHIQAVYKNAKVFAFYPLMLHLHSSLFGTKKEDQSFIDHIFHTTDEGDGYIATVRNLHRQMESRTEYLKEIELNYLTRLRDILQPLTRTSGPTDLFGFTRKVLWDASLTGLYGPRGFQAEPDFHQAYHLFDLSQTTLIANFWPPIFAPRAYKAREDVVAAIRRFVSDPARVGEASTMVQERVRVSKEHGVTSDELRGRLELGLFFALLQNAPGVAFWMVVHAFHDPELLQSLRREAEPALQRSAADDDGFLIETHILREECPLLRSFFDECLRLYARIFALRLVTEETTLATKDRAHAFRLQKGGIVTSSVRISHTDPAIWGNDSFQLNPERFLLLEREKGSRRRDLKHDAYRPFGGGIHLCPGRNLAWAEVSSFVATLLLFFDIRFESPGVPGTRVKGDLGGGTILNPLDPVLAAIERRRGFEQAAWNYI